LTACQQISFSFDQSATKLAASLERVSELQTSHAGALDALRTQLSESEKRAHESALSFARTEAKLSSVQERVGDVERQRDALAADLAKASEQLAAARTAAHELEMRLAQTEPANPAAKAKK
jgi:chromosome segregation ATPase